MSPSWPSKLDSHQGLRGPAGLATVLTVTFACSDGITPTGPASGRGTLQAGSTDATTSVPASGITGANDATLGAATSASVEPSASATDDEVGSGGSASTGSTTASIDASTAGATGPSDTGLTSNTGTPGSAGGATCSTGATGSTGAAAPARFAEVQGYVIAYCATSTACHGPGAREVVFSQTTLFDTLMTLNVARCENQPMVVPYSPSESALYNVLTGGCSNFRMPPACQSNACTGADNARLVESWIQDGAPPD